MERAPASIRQTSETIEPPFGAYLGFHDFSLANQNYTPFLALLADLPLVAGRLPGPHDPLSLCAIVACQKLPLSRDRASLFSLLGKAAMAKQSLR